MPYEAGIETQKSGTYKGASGAIEITLRNDMLFHYVLQKSNVALKGLVCALKGLRQEDVRDVVLTNAIDYGRFHGKEIRMDARIMFNHGELMDVELQMYRDANWHKRSILYLGRSYDSIGHSEQYAALRPTTLVAIVDRPLFPEPEFYARFLMMNVRTHRPYTEDYGLNILDISQVGRATAEDEAAGLVRWARMIRATRWEDVRSIAAGHEDMEEVAENMYNVNILQDEEKTLFEAHEKYLCDLASLQSSAAEAQSRAAEAQSRAVEAQSRLDDAQSRIDLLERALRERGVDPDAIL